ncbi:MAG: sugar O-acetyltransferase [Paracoccus sp. (in: a-proteobacteria)]
MISEKQKMLSGQLYNPADPELLADRDRASAWMDRYNAAISGPDAGKLTMLRELFTSVGNGCLIRPPFFCDYGQQITLGQNVFLNFNCTILDVAPVSIGDGSMFGPGVQILAADHPVNPAERATMLELARAVSIGRNVWIGGGAIILPGITVGDDAIIGAGAVVTRDVAPGARVVGNPARSR